MRQVVSIFFSLQLPFSQFLQDGLIVLSIVDRFMPALAGHLLLRGVEEKGDDTLIDSECL